MIRDWKKKFEEFLKGNYELVEEHEKKCLIHQQPANELCSVFGLRIYKAKALNNLPEEMLDVIKDDFHWSNSLVGRHLGCCLRLSFREGWCQEMDDGSVCQFHPSATFFRAAAQLLFHELLCALFLSEVVSHV